MSQKRTKVKMQITLPESLILKIHQETFKDFRSVSLWFEKVLTNYFNEKEKESQVLGKKRIELNF